MLAADPQNILERVPELAELTHLPKVRRAIERGDLHGLYRVLFFAKLRGQLPDKRELLTMLLARRRLFLTPLRGRLLLTTVNGVGATVYGRSDVDPDDGTYVKTWFLVLLFVPVFPLGQYLVRDAGKGKWTFMGKVPLGPLLWFWRSGFSLALLGSILFALVSAIHASRYNSVYVLNALPIPVQLQLDGQRALIGANDRLKLDVRAGVHPIVVRAQSGRVLEQGTVHVRPGVDAQGWNILGAAALVYEQVVYHKVEPEHPDAPKPTFGCGTREFNYDPVTDVFTDPPKTVSMPKHAERVTRTHVGVFASGSRACVGRLRQQGQSARAAQLAREVAIASDYDVEASLYALASTDLSTDVQPALELARAALAKHDDALALHRAYQDLSATAGQRAQVVAEYEARLNKNPGDVDAAYLAARLKPNAEARPLFDALVARAPHNASVLSSHAMLHFNDGDYAGALASWQTLEKTDAAAYANALPYVAQALVALGRKDAALAALERPVAHENSRDGIKRALTYAQIAQLLGSEPDKLARQLVEFQSDSVRGWFHARCGRALERSELAAFDPEMRALVGLILASQHSPAAALELVPKASPRMLEALPEEVWLLLYAESVLAAGRGDDAPEKALRAASPGGGPLALAIANFVREGTHSEELADLTPELRAALHFARSRNPALSAAERARWQAHARSEDLLQGAVSRAMSTWPQ